MGALTYVRTISAQELQEVQAAFLADFRGWVPANVHSDKEEAEWAARLTPEEKARLRAENTGHSPYERAMCFYDLMSHTRRRIFYQRD